MSSLLLVTTIVAFSVSLADRPCNVSYNTAGISPMDARHTVTPTSSRTKVVVPTCIEPWRCPTWHSWLAFAFGSLLARARFGARSCSGRPPSTALLTASACRRQAQQLAAFGPTGAPGMDRWGPGASPGTPGSSIRFAHEHRDLRPPRHRQPSLVRCAESDQHQRGRIRSPARDRQGAGRNHAAIGQIFAEAPARASPIQGHNDGPEWQAPILPTGPRPASHHHDHRGHIVGTERFEINNDQVANAVTWENMVGVAGFEPTTSSSRTKMERFCDLLR